MGKCCFLGNSNYRRTVINPAIGLVEMTCGVVHASYSLPEWQAVKLTFFAPCMRISKSPGMIFKIRKLNLAAKLQCLQENNPSCDHPEAMELW